MVFLWKCQNQLQLLSCQVFLFTGGQSEQYDGPGDSWLRENCPSPEQQDHGEGCCHHWPEIGGGETGRESKGPQRADR